MNKLAIVGSGAWGTALASVLSENFETTSIWSFLEEEAAEINRTKVNSKYLPEIVLDKVQATTSIQDTVKDAAIIISVVPSFAIRKTWEEIMQYQPDDALVVNASKGIEKETHLLPYQQFIEIFGNDSNYFSLSGPSFAKEVAEGRPTAVNLAGKDRTTAEHITAALKNETFHLRYSDDIIGTELGGVLKNVIAIVSGMILGSGYGPNTQALVVVEGIQEMMKLGNAMGAKEESFLGLSGLGDLLLTAMNDQSRNMNFGIVLGKGLSLKKALEDQKGVAEGYYTTFSVDYLLQKYHLSLPLLNMVVDILVKKMPIQERFNSFMKKVF